MDHHQWRDTGIWLIRHGESTWNADGLIQGHCDTPGLTAAGRAQAEELATSLPLSRIGSLFSSDLRRAVQTARPLAAATGLPIRTDERLRERALGPFEGLPTATLTPEVTGVFDGTVVDPDAAVPGMESLRDVLRRVSEFLAILGDEVGDGDIAVVTHGGALRMLRAALNDHPLAMLAWDDVPNAHVERLPLNSRCGTSAPVASPKEDAP